MSLFPSHTTALYFTPTVRLPRVPFFFFFNDTATTEIYTLSLHDALPISLVRAAGRGPRRRVQAGLRARRRRRRDRKSTRLNSSHDQISYAVFCLKKKKQQPQDLPLAVRE